jgi:GTP cyclohydrolase II
VEIGCFIIIGIKLIKLISNPNQAPNHLEDEILKIVDTNKINKNKKLEGVSIIRIRVNP